MAYNSALAQITSNTSNIVTKEFIPGKYVNLDYDNIDFKEESSQQTHVTNGIIIQKTSTDPLLINEPPTEQAPLKKKQRYVVAPGIPIPHTLFARKRRQNLMVLF